MIAASALLVVAMVLTVAGLVLLALGGIGVLRFPDVYTRVHAHHVVALGVSLALLGLAAQDGDWSLRARLVVLAVLVGALGPALSQTIASAAHAGGLSPIVGRYSAPRPGRREERA